MFREITALGFVIMLLFCLPNQLCASSKVYVSDIQRITFRTGPSLDHKIMAFLLSGQALEVLEKEGDWSRVRILGGSDDGKEGWVLNQYLIDRVPYRLQTSSLMDENRTLKERLEPIKRQLEESAAREKNLSAKLEKNEAALFDLQEEFLTLKQEASEYLALKEEYEEIRSRLQIVEEQNINLKAENDKLKESERKTWFLSGALVLLCGLLLGIILGRQHKRKSTYY